MAEVLLTEDFLERVYSGEHLLLDVRSESEFFHGSIPGAVNVPLLNDEARKEVGITYKKEGRSQAVEKGFELTGGKFVDFIRSVKNILQHQTQNAETKTVFLYCWRGGMRSSIMSWILETAGIRTTLLKGGYKSYRRWALQQFKKERSLIILGGKTGTGKTFLLNELRKSGEQVLDLEALAHHRGSVFGGLGNEPQPRQEHFENLIAHHLSKTNPELPLWVENESRKVGSVKIPDALFDKMLVAPLIEIIIPFEERVNRILEEYGKFSVEELCVNTKKIERALGGGRLKEALQFLDEGNLVEWIKMMLVYYDKTYQYGLSLRNLSLNFPIEISYSNFINSLEKILLEKDKIISSASLSITA
ncbi:MAG: tRNA 2-selenouridine(34) synthase MnmH [Bacteroidia bacterium]|nr:tRNA 2-selenouridine(34) synthase MnmH [Bacteroidia bacterium]